MTLAAVLQCLVVLALILANGFFAAAEMALVTSRKIRLDRMASRGDAGARAALVLSEKPERFLATLQIGVTLLSILSGAYGEASLGRQLAELMGRVPLLAPHAPELGLGLVVTAITLATLVLGELVPKRLAIARSEAVAARLSRPVTWLVGLAAPLSWLLSAAAHLALAALGVKEGPPSHVSEEELKLLVRQAASAGVLEEAERDMLERVMRLGDRPVGSLMTHRSRIASLDLERPERIPEIIRSRPFNRFPVVRGGLENLLGVAEAKDLLAESSCLETLDLQSVLVQPPHVLETTTTFTLLAQLKLAGQNLAVVVDEFGDVMGLVTFTDVLAAIAGDMVLPEGSRAPRVEARPDGSWLVDATTPVVEVFDLLDATPPPGDFQTLAGFVLQALGRIPAAGDAFEHSGHRFEVAGMDGRRVDRVLVQKLPAEPGAA
jgi:putative hemolysin